MAARKKLDLGKEVRRLARERLGPVPAAKRIEPATKRKKPKHKRPLSEE